MKRLGRLRLLSALAILVGMAQAGCDQFSGLILGLRSPPAIIPFGPAEDTLTRTFSVDLRRYPDAQQVTWDFGDGATTAGMPISAGKVITHNFVRAGTFNVVVYLFSGPDIATGAGPRMIGVGTLPVDVVGPNASPTAMFIIEEVLDGSGDPIAAERRFNALRSRDPDGTLVDFQWDFGDGATGSGAVVNHAYLTSGRFDVRLTITDDRGATSSIVRSVLVNAGPTASFTFQASANDDLTITFDGRSSSDPDGTIGLFSWNFGDNSAVVQGDVVTHTYAAPDVYTVTLTVTDNLGATGSTSQSVDATGDEPFARSLTPDFGVVDTIVANIGLDGENFESGATAQLRQGVTQIDAQTAVFLNPQTMVLSFDLSAAPLGDYDLVVENPGGGTTTLTAAFRVVTPNLVRLTTNLGDMVFELVDDAPVTTANFLQYVDDNFYDLTIFHRVVPNFVIQGGGFLPGMIERTGVRDPIVNEFSPTRSNVRGTVAMAKLGNDPNSATSQFFVNLADNSANLDNQNGGFTVFANVIEGMDVADAIAAVPLNGEVPVNDVILISAERE